MTISSVLVTTLKFVVISTMVLAVLIIAARVIFALPESGPRINSKALPPNENGPLANALKQRAAAYPNLTGIAPLQNGADAFAARIILANAAVSSIDAQYYIWRGDLTGYLLLDALQRAADRGVRVRLLLDDNGTSGIDAELAALDAHRNIEVRLYNPFNLRRFKLLSYGFDFFRLNRRMHNKSFTVDGLATVVGGRNVADEYFSTGPTALYFDLDVLAVGDIVSAVAADFDRYWASPSVHPTGPLLPKVDGTDPIATGLATFNGKPQIAQYRELLNASNIVNELAQGDLALEWTSALLVSDDPIKGQGAVAREDLLASRLADAVGNIESKLDGISPYFVPGVAGVEALSKLEARGVQVRMLTNSLEATDVLPVHAGYAKRRKALLDAGIELFELRRLAAPRLTAPHFRPLGSSGASLHAKTFAVDGRRIFVGSFNFDPRSTTLNTEMGLLIDSTAMAERVHTAFDQQLSGMAWKVERAASGNVVWIDDVDGLVIEEEPGASTFKSIALNVIGWLPVEWLL